MRRAEAVVVNKAGLHARAAAKLVETTSRFASEIRIGHQQMINGKSILALMMLAAVRGTRLRVETEGADEEEALTSVIALIEDGFGEDS